MFDAATACGEFLLEGLYVNNRLSEYNSKGKTFFRNETGRYAASEALRLKSHLPTTGFIIG